MKKALKFFAVIITVLVIAFTGFFIFLVRGLGANSQPELSGVTAAGLQDGTYEGGYDGGRWTNRVKVTVAGEQITEIALLQDVMFTKPETSAELFQKVVDAQSTEVDAVAGATVTCHAYLKAIENALTEGEK